MPIIEFALAESSLYIEVNQVLKAAGACDSGGVGKRLAADGQVNAGGVPESRKTAKIRPGQINVTKFRLADPSLSPGLWLPLRARLIAMYHIFRFCCFMMRA